jgi:hypothetical protein
MSTPKIRTTVYSHKVIDVVKFRTLDTPDWEIEELFNDLFLKLMECSESDGFVHIKVDRPLSPAEGEHRMGVVAKNIEKNNKYRNWYSKKYQEEERKEYLRLKEKYGE